VTALAALAVTEPAAAVAKALRVTITVNGEARELATGTTLETLLEMLGVRRDGTAVALNDDVVPRAQHAGVALRAGDRLEIIVAVAGG
jgi:sulfur carrier protein